MDTRPDTPADLLDTSRARDAIFARIRNAQHRPEQPTQGERDAVADYLARHPAGPRPPMSDDLAGHFAEQATKMASTLDTVATLADVPAAAARYLSGLGLAPRAVAWTTLQSLDWAAAGIAVEFRPPIREPQADHAHGDLVGITGCFCAIAETGSLMLLSGPENVASTALLPETHIAVVPQSRIVAHLEDAYALMRAERGELPRATNVISGPSRTGDIEQTIVLGAHGPYRVHVIVVSGA
ncbi:LutC/YkgG family protein [Ralstonia mannitolilytica]|uniref:Lactate utilization protein C n=1 Tax=Ralstonia mannitolilytica TaxID=105219 RepID=A0AAD2AL70_9RALS|nr:lactate utilization protein C [Ralstonia mannitolilytica]ATG20327.1 lactate utilization protein C [Ralstonia pickettii]ANA34393.1 membrane protein [Ralstonia mannitolilytica]MBY4719936.1 lactate utilization protein C [Ralstonia mannitolilytica]CAJ0680615.1 Lactate utilization protein C [Ralstonia mannitolilytica]CAJ0682236.1 Lactate utilization protein C [Ralstonia mannitolilytica]